MPASSPSGEAPVEHPVFVSDHSLRRILVRGGVGLLASLFVVWVIALASGVSGVGTLPGLEDKLGTGAEPADAGPASGRSENAIYGEPAGETAPSSKDAGGTAAQPAPRQTTTGTTQVAPTPVAPSTDGTTGAPDVTPGGNVPGANANDGAGDAGKAYGGGSGGGRTKTG